jgi:metal-dependent amidase/aminoacylase/carboxypeptidase family protein
VIASQASLVGTTRCFRPEIRNQFPAMIERVAKNTAQSYRAEAELDYRWGTPPIINETQSAQLAGKAVKELFSEDRLVDLAPVMTGEDFAMYLQQTPGILAFLGVRNEAEGAYYPHHHERFAIDESALKSGVALYAEYARRYLNN